MAPAASKPRPNSDRDSVVTRVAGTLSAGRLAILPTETVYGVAAHAGMPEAIQALRAARIATSGGSTSASPYPVSTWHAAHRDVVSSLVPLTGPVHKRIVDRLLPGPVSLLIELGEAKAGELIKALAAVPGVFDSRGVVAIRVPDHPMTARVLEQVKGPVVIDRLSRFGLGDGRDLESLPQGTPGIDAVLDDGPTTFGAPSSTVLLNAAGGYRVLSEGAVDAKTIHSKIERLVLFVCTGNTCRSPMAEAIARELFERSQRNVPRVPVRFASAGVATTDGLPVSGETREALEQLGFPPPPARSRELLDEMVEEADVIFAMTPEHVRAVSRVPAGKGKVFLLDPAGKEVPDPIGGPLSLYRETANKMRPLIEKRLQELESRP